MPKYIDEDGLKKSIWEYTDKYWHIEMTITFFNILLERNRADAEPVVRCKDCKWCHAGYCEKADDIIPFGFAHHEWENFYCAWGERREDETD